MRVTAITSLFPAPRRPYEGIFAERRWAGLAARGHQVAVVHPLPYCPPLPLGARRLALRAAPRISRQRGCEVYRPRYLHLPGLAVGNAERFARRGARAALEQRPDVVVADYAWPAAAAVPLLRAAGVPAVVSGRGSDLVIARSDSRLARRLTAALRMAEGWCAVAEHLVRSMDALEGHRHAGVLVPNGVDLDLFAQRPRRAARRALELGVDGRLVLVVGHLIPRKDPLLALAAFAAALPELGEARIAFVGSGPLERRLRRRAAALGIEGRLLMVGEQPPERLADWYAAADCLLLCSLWEGRPNVVMEALASGRPVIATHTDGTAELLAGNPDMVVADRDPAALAARLGRLLATPPAAEQLRATVSDLTWEASCEALEELLQRAIDGKHPA